MTDRPRVLFLGRNLELGGAERVFVDLANGARDIEPVVALLERRGALLTALSPTIECFARANEASSSAFPGEQFTRLVPEVRWLRGVARRTGAQLVSSFLMRSHIVALLTKVLLQPSLRVVVNLHEHMSEGERFLYPTVVDRTLMRWVTRHLFPRADRIVVVADALKRDLVDNFGVPASLIELSYNPLDLDEIRAAAHRHPEGARAAQRRHPEGAKRPRDRYPGEAVPLQVVAVARLVYSKGIDLLLRAFAKLRSTQNAVLTIVGDGDQRANLESLAHELRLNDIVTFAGMQSNPWQFMASADVFALTSRTEAFPRVLMEAMAVGVPVLATECTAGIRECLLDGECGVIVPHEDVDGIARGLHRLLSDAALRARLAAAGKNRVAAFDPATVQRRYESILIDAIASRTV